MQRPARRKASMTNYGGNGWGWTGSTGISYENVTTPISALGGLDVTAGQSVGFSGGVMYPALANVATIDIWLVDGNGNYVSTIDSGTTNALSPVFGLSFNGSFTVETTGTYGIAAVYYDSNGGGAYGDVLETDFTVNVSSSGGYSSGGSTIGDPTIVVTNVTYNGTTAGGEGSCIYNGASNCTFVNGSTINAIVYFYSTGGPTAGVSCTCSIEYNGNVIGNSNVGVVVPYEYNNSNTAEVSFPMTGSGTYTAAISFNSTVSRSTITSFLSMQLSSYVPTAAPANLVITTGPVLSKTQIYTGGTATISVTIQNNGGSPSSVALLSLWPATGDPTWGGTQVSIPQISPNQSYTATATYAASQQASGTVTICALIST